MRYFVSMLSNNFVLIPFSFIIFRQGRLRQSIVLH
jgi:hypothetical protein